MVQQGSARYGSQGSTLIETSRLKGEPHDQETTLKPRAGLEESACPTPMIAL